MFEWLSRILGPPKAVGPAEVVRKFSAGDVPIDVVIAALDKDAWRIAVDGDHSVQLFHASLDDVAPALLTYRAELKTDGLDGRAYLELWCDVVDRKNFFSKGLKDAVTGTSDWSTHEVSFYLRKGQRAHSVRLNLAAQGTGTVWIRNLVLEQTPLAGR